MSFQSAISVQHGVVVLDFKELAGQTAIGIRLMPEAAVYLASLLANAAERAGSGRPLESDSSGADEKEQNEAINATAINEFAAECHRRNREAGWWEPGEWTSVPAKLCLAHSEISEALEGYRKDLMDDKLPHRKMIEVELADVMIRIGDLATWLGLNLGDTINEKLEYNLHRQDHKIEVRKRAGGKKF